MNGLNYYIGDFVTYKGDYRTLDQYRRGEDFAQIVKLSENGCSMSLNLYSSKKNNLDSY